MSDKPKLGWCQGYMALKYHMEEALMEKLNEAVSDPKIALMESLNEAVSNPKIALFSKKNIIIK